MPAGASRAEFGRPARFARFRRFPQHEIEGISLAGIHSHALTGAQFSNLLAGQSAVVGELRNRAERMCSVGDLQAVEELLQNLMEREVPLVMRLPRQAGRKEHRFAHLLSGTPEIEETSALPIEPARLKVTLENDRITRLEEEVATLRAELDEVCNQLKAFRAQFE